MASSSDIPALEETEMEKHTGEVENVGTEEELEKKLNSLNIFGFSITNWIKYLFNCDNNETFKAEWLSTDEYMQMAEESMKDAWDTIRLPGWRLEKRGVVKGDLVESLQTENFGKVYRFTGVVSVPAKFLFDEFKNNITKLPEWYPTILKSELIKEIGPGVDLSHQVTAGGGRGIIAPRDFIILRRTAALDKEGREVETDPYCYITNGVSVSVPGYPPCSDMVRGHNKVGCWCMTPKLIEVNGEMEQHTVFQWLMCCDLKGNIPQFVLDAAFASAMLDYILHIRKFTSESKEKGLF